ncbi:MAG: RNA recognition motif domain-containing protein [Ardenticatenaceae bacterium]
MNIYVGNLNFRTEEPDLRAAFAAYGEVDTVNIITDRDTGRARGFGFVEMPSDEEAQAAIDALNEKELDGRMLKVNKAKPRGERRGGGGRGRGGGGYGGNRGGGGGYGGNRGGGGYGGGGGYSSDRW